MAYSTPSCPSTPDVKSKKKGDEDSGDDNVAETEHRKVVSSETLLEEILWKNHWKECKMEKTTINMTVQKKNLICYKMTNSK